MAPQFLPQARFEVPQNALLNLAPLNDAIDSNRRSALLDRQFAADERSRQAQLGIQQERLGLERQRSEREDGAATVQRFGRMANYALSLPAGDPRRKQIYDRVMGEYTRRMGSADKLFAEDPGWQDPDTALGMLAAEAGAWKDPLDRKKAQADIDLKNAQAGYYRTRGAADGPDRVGLQPIYGVDAEGNPVVMQPSSTGQMVRSQMPEGVTVSRTPVRMDAGTHFVLLDPITRQQIGTVPKDIAGAESARAVGKARGEAVVDLPTALQKGQQALTLINEAIDHPGRATATGMSSYFDPRAYLPGTNARDFYARNRQLQGQTFLEAFESLKGGGHITEVEGQKASDAIARLDTSQSDGAYLQALKDLRAIVSRGMQRARQRAGDGAAPAPGVDTDPLGIR